MTAKNWKTQVLVIFLTLLATIALGIAIRLIYTNSPTADLRKPFTHTELRPYNLDGYFLSSSA